MNKTITYTYDTGGNILKKKSMPTPPARAARLKMQLGFQIAASGILAINIPAMIIFPAVDITIEPIEWTGQN